MLPNLFLLLIAAGFYVWMDLDKGVEEALQPFDDALPTDEEEVERK